jgi:RNA-binding protein 5/10
MGSDSIDLLDCKCCLFVNSVCLFEQYDAIGWAPKEYNPDEKQNNNLEPQNDGSAAHSGFVWDEKSGYYYDAASGFYYDGNTGKSAVYCRGFAKL